MNLKIAWLIGSILLFAFFADAQTEPRKTKPLRFLLGGALEFGGDDIAEVYFMDGSTQKMNAGQGGTVFAGGQLALNKEGNFFLRGSIGIKYLTTKADNAHIRLTRIPLQASLNYFPVKKLRLAAGMVSHQAIRINFDGLGDNAKFTSAPGPVFEIAYAGFGLSYTLLTYKGTNESSFRANAIGITFSGVL
jgi:hypothetical protein